MGNKCFRPGEGAGDYQPSKEGKVKNQMQGPGTISAPNIKQEKDGLEIEAGDQTDTGAVENLLNPGKKISMEDF